MPYYQICLTFPEKRRQEYQNFLELLKLHEGATKVEVFSQATAIALLAQQNGWNIERLACFFLRWKTIKRMAGKVKDKVLLDLLENEIRSQNIEPTRSTGEELLPSLSRDKDDYKTQQ